MHMCVCNAGSWMLLMRIMVVFGVQWMYATMAEIKTIFKIDATEFRINQSVCKQQ